MEARRLMGLTTTNFENLIYATGYCYLHCHKDMQDNFSFLLEEITRRKLYVDIGI